jgi:high-affinity iron transporter
MGDRRLLIAGAIAVCAAAAAVTAFAAVRGGGDPRRIVVSDAGCAFDWKPPHSGRTIFTVANTTSSTVYSVALVGANQSTIYGQINELAPGTALPLDVVLPPGEYAFQCQTGSGYGLVSPTERVTGGQVADAHPYRPVSNEQMMLAAYDYRTSLQPILNRLAADTDRLAAAVEAGKLETARRLWLPAHLDYARLGAAYDAFAQFNDEINGRPLGLQGGVHDPSFKGYLRLEYGLWHGQSASELRPVASALDRAVHGLLRRFPQLQIPFGDVALRAHEILENTLQFELTAKTDEGSHTSLATAWANAEGTRLVLDTLTTALGVANPQLLSEAKSGVDRFETQVASYRRPDGQWAPLQSLTETQRERLDASLSGLLETLELIPDVLQAAPTGGGDHD